MALAVGIWWLAHVIFAFALAGWLLWRRGPCGVVPAALLVAGSLLGFGLFSAAVGLAEETWSTSSAGFLIAVAVGIVGEGLFATGLLGLRRTQA